MPIWLHPTHNCYTNKGKTVLCMSINMKLSTCKKYCTSVIPISNDPHLKQENNLCCHHMILENGHKCITYNNKMKIKTAIL